MVPNRVESSESIEREDRKMLGRYENMEAVEEARKEAFPFSGYGNAKVGDNVVVEDAYKLHTGDGEVIEGTQIYIGVVDAIDYLPMVDRWRMLVNVRTGTRSYVQVAIFRDNMVKLQRITYKPTFRTGNDG